MDLYKITHFNHESEGVAFPWFDALDENESRQVRQAFGEQLGLAERLPDDAEIYAALQPLCFRVNDVNANHADFRLSGILASFGITPLHHVYLDWAEDEDRFGATMDEMSFADLDANLGMLWYPDLDDLLIFDDTFSWACEITLTGDVNLMQMKCP